MHTNMKRSKWCLSVCLSKTFVSLRREDKKGDKEREEKDIEDEMLPVDNPFTPNTPWVIENDNNAARGFCTAAHRYMFLPGWHNCHSSSIFYRSSINLCCRSVRTVGGARRFGAPLYLGLCETLAQDAAEDERSHDRLSPKTPSSTMSPHRFDVKLQLKHRYRTLLVVDANKLILAVSAVSTIYFNDASRKQKKKWKKKRKQELEPETCNGGDSEASGSLTMTHRTTFISNKKKSHNMFSWLIVKNEKWISQQANRCLEFWFLKVWDRKECFEGRGNISMGEIGAGNLPLEWRRQPCFIMEEIQCDMLRMNCSVNQKYPLF